MDRIFNLRDVEVHYLNKILCDRIAGIFCLSNMAVVILRIRIPEESSTLSRGAGKWREIRIPEE